jgi:RNA polymerase sigma factor (sigma-70 family)
MTRYTFQDSVEHLVEGCRQNDRLAQQYLYRKLYGKMLGVAMRYAKSREDAESILNIAFLKVFQNIHSYSAAAPFEHWVYRVVVFTGIDEVRKVLKIKYMESAEHLPEGEIGNSGLENLEVDDIYKCIQQLEPTSRSVFSLYEIDGYKHAEIAEMLEITESSSRWYLAKAKKALQAMITEMHVKNNSNHQSNDSIATH